MRWRKVRGQGRWRTEDGWEIAGNDAGGYQSFKPNGNMVVFYGNSLRDAKRLTDGAAAQIAANAAKGDG